MSLAIPRSHILKFLQGYTYMLTSPPDFLESAEDVRFDIEGDNQPILRARLRTVDGEYEDRDLNLTERIMNRDGNLCFEG